MNKKNFLEKISKFILSKNHVKDESALITGLTTNLQSAKSGDVVFYKIGPDQKSKELFYKRMQEVEYSLLVLNNGAQFVKNENVIFIDEFDFLKIQKIACDDLYPNKNRLKIVGVTGTNGKTTTVNLAMQISGVLGHPAISVGTIGVFDEKKMVYPDLESTTPSYLELRKIIHHFQEKKDVIFMEVSSHALAQDRLFDIKLDAVAWTSFSQDHLDYHKSMDEYFKAKLLIERKYLKEERYLLLPYLEKELALKISELSPNTRYKISKTLQDRKIEKYPLFYYSNYNKSNIELALQLNEELWNKKIEGFDLNTIQTPKGRFSVIEIGETSMAIIDYAHTPDALVNIGNAIKEAFPAHKIIALFGCGGNRDKTKRPLMGKAVCQFADRIMVTSDNPRDENPEDIIVDIIPGIDREYSANIDRKKAIIECLLEMEENEILLIAGKGHEEYQEIKGTKHPFSDFDIVLNYKQEMGV